MSHTGLHLKVRFAKQGGGPGLHKGVRLGLGPGGDFHLQLGCSPSLGSGRLRVRVVLDSGCTEKGGGIDLGSVSGPHFVCLATCNINLRAVRAPRHTMKYQRGT